jgi:hypothetical protein
MAHSKPIEESERGVFSFHGIIGYAIAVGLLLSILVGLSIWGLNVQQSQATNVYYIKDIQNLKQIDEANKESYKLVKE